MKKCMWILKKPTITETIRLHRLRWFGHVQRMEENRIPKRVLYINLETTRPRGRPRNRWLDEVREDGRMVGGEEWQEKVYDREEWRRLLRMARNHRILYMPMDWLIDWIEQHSKFLLHTLQVLYMYTLCDSTNINTIIDNHRWHATNSLERTRLSCWCL